MVNIESQSSCALCGQLVEIKGFSLTNSEGIQKFCCGGCLSIYRLLHCDHNYEPLINSTNNNEDNTNESL